jgi:hypothetical protein
MMHAMKHKNYTVKYQNSAALKNVKYLEFYVGGGVLLLVAFFVVVGLINTGTNEFDQLVGEEVERFHQQIAAENYEEIYLQAGRKLIVSFDRTKFENLLRLTRPQIVGKVKKNCVTNYADMVERLKRIFGRPFQLETDCRVENETISSRQYLDWHVNGKEIKLIWFSGELQKH